MIESIFTVVDVCKYFFAKW